MTGKEVTNSNEVWGIVVPSSPMGRRKCSFSLDMMQKGLICRRLKICGETWHDSVLGELSDIRLRVLIGASAHRYHLGVKSSVTETVAGWRDHARHTFVLPRPSWRNTGWLKKNPWFEGDVLPKLRARVKEVLND